MPHYEPLAYQTFTQAAPSLPTLALPELVHMDDPATQVMLSKDIVAQCLITANMRIDAALMQMHRVGTHVLLVMDEQHQLSGIITSRCLLGKKPIQLLNERRITREQLQVQHLMQPIANLICINVNELKHATVGHIVTTLDAAKQKQALVFEEDKTSNTTNMVGLFDQSQIEHQLHLRIQ